MTKKKYLFSRVFPNLRLRLLNLAIIKNIPTTEFETLIKSLNAEGWYVKDEFYDFGVINQRAKIDLQKNRGSLTLEWDNKNNGSIEGDGELIREVACNHGFTPIDNRHWIREDDFAA